MLKSITAIISAAAVAGFVTLAFAPTSPVDAGPLEKPAEATLKACSQKAWPYLNCVGTTVGNPRIRVIAIDRQVADNQPDNRADASQVAAKYRNGAAD